MADPADRVDAHTAPPAHGFVPTSAAAVGAPPPPLPPQSDGAELRSGPPAAGTARSAKPRSLVERALATSTLSRVQAQIEFYLSDVNLHHDRFLRQRLLSRPDGSVDLELLLTFNKLKGLTRSAGVVRAAIGRSEALELCREGTAVRRKQPYQHPTDDSVVSRTVFMEGLKPSATVAVVSQLMTRFGKVLVVRLSRDATGCKGFGFIEFETQEQADAACANVKTLPANDHVASQHVSIVPMKSWLDWQRAVRDHHADLKRSASGDANTTGILVRLSPLGDAVHIKAIRSLIKQVSTPQFIDFQPGSSTAIVRFACPEDAAHVINFLSHHPVLLGSASPVKAAMLPPDEEQEYLQAVHQAMSRSQESKTVEPPREKRRRTALEISPTDGVISRAAKRTRLRIASPPDTTAAADGLLPVSLERAVSSQSLASTTSRGSGRRKYQRRSPRNKDGPRTPRGPQTPKAPKTPAGRQPTADPPSVSSMMSTPAAAQPSAT